MLSALSSYIWGTDEDETKTENVNIEDQIELENDWIFVRPKETVDLKRRHVNFNDDSASSASDSSAANGMEESWLVTPPQCFNSKRRRNKNAKASPMENLLIEHPSMSIYQDKDEPIEETGETSQEIELRQGETHRAVAGRLQELEKRQPLKDLNTKSQKNGSAKSMKRKNMVYVRSHTTRKNKQYGRMSGKQSGMVGKRGT